MSYALEAPGMTNFQDPMDESPYFNSYMLAAERKEYENMAKITELYVYFQSVGGRGAWSLEGPGQVVLLPIERIVCFL